jgi:hypothetical protein
LQLGAMNPKYFGDSYDIVKRFFCGELAKLGYVIAMEPMLTGQWEGREQEFYRFVGISKSPEPSSRIAAFFDPDTGVQERPSLSHLSLGLLSEAAHNYHLSFSFDQAFSRKYAPSQVMQRKLAALKELGTFGMYYDSHARFLFASAQQGSIDELRRHLVALGMPPSRLVRGP